MSQLSVRSKTVVLFSCVAVPFSFVPVIMATERGTGLHGTPGCLHPRWVALSHGESAHANFTSLLLRLCTTCSLFKKTNKTPSIIILGVQKMKEYLNLLQSWMSKFQFDMISVFSVTCVDFDLLLFFVRVCFYNLCRVLLQAVPPP